MKDKFEAKLVNAFDFQRFEQNEKLSAIICKSQKDFGIFLSDDDLEQVNAAGETGFMQVIGDSDDKEKKHG